MNQQQLERDKALKKALQRYFDRELPESERREVESWLEENATTKDYLKALQEIHDGVVAAEESLWEGAGKPSSDLVLNYVNQHENLLQEKEEDLESLAPLIERYADGEADSWEEAYIVDLIEKRQDVRDYLNSIKWTSEGVRLGVGSLFDEFDEKDAELSSSSLNQVDFSNFWSGVSEKLKDSSTKTESKEFSLQDVILYYDGELDDAATSTCRDVIYSPDNYQARELLLSLKDVNHCVKLAAKEILYERSFDNLYPSIVGKCAGLNISAPDASIAATDSNESTQVESSKVEGEASNNNVALTEILPNSKKGESSELSEFSSEKAGQKAANDNFFTRNRQAFAGAVAALAVMGIASIVYFALGGANQTIIHKTVVVVEDVQYGPGFSGEVINPVQQVSSKPEDFKPAADGEEDPTVIWVYDDPNQPQVEGKDSKNVDGKTPDGTRPPIKKNIKAPGLSL